MVKTAKHRLPTQKLLCSSLLSLDKLDIFHPFSKTGLKTRVTAISYACCCVKVLRPTNSCHTETGPRFKASSERLEKAGIKLWIPDLQGE